MKRIGIFSFFLFSTCSFCLAQNEANWWYFGDSCGLHFSTGNPQCLMDGHLSSLNGCASISDSNGNLLFYSNGYKVWNRNHEVMSNSDSLFNYSITTNYHDIALYWGSPSNSGILILTINGHYFLIHNNTLAQYDILGFDTIFKGIYVSEIDMSQASGLGDVVSFKKLYSYPTNSVGGLLSESIGAVRHGNGRDWWLNGHQIDPDSTNRFYEFLITSDSIFGPFYQDIGNKNYWSGGGSKFDFNRNGNKLLATECPGIVDVFDFNRCSGQLSNEVDLSVITQNGGIENNRIYGASFSPSGELIYYNTWKYLIQIHPKLGETGTYERDTIWQNPDFININNCTGGSNNCIITGNEQLAPNGKIYIASTNYFLPDSTYLVPLTNFNTNLSVINNPDSISIACDFQPWVINLCGKRDLLSLPQMLNYSLSALDGSSCDSLGLGVNNRQLVSLINIYPNPANNELTIEVLNGIAPKQIEITNSSGVIVVKLKQTKPNQQVNIKSLAGGLYFVKVYMKDGSVTVMKFVKN